MKFSSQEEYGLRLLLRIGKSDSEKGMTIPELSEVEGLSEANVAKILRTLRLAGFVESSRGQTGGYKLTRAAKEILIGDILTSLGGKLYESSFCDLHAGVENICTHSIDCSIRSLWKTVQTMLDGLLSKITLQDLLGNEQQVELFVTNIAEELEK
ncbi:MAG TPA: Rrf2 family transcriptional regulator [Ignavibacteriaceae bacterium]|jgi:Rrf2 family protein|nr:MAG: HTH-type transcriptional regulator CymR [Ignavibacteria bacterium ADurb.Bin266]OQY74972.1 MAG: transcriptional regulator [Ignavibacteriales bacterium UTCHB2]HQF41660.1 Rrf2 family transcriptional regulator [Ignavibacteriaceae bacterium]HQI39486.1 Rrf2 family transcriptional regulator [Ignavibacteriaceae bacterium]HQJ45849.1 Rrf2 family transcriptional regulator [Ignavibacteriaceae bacterium]